MIATLHICFARHTVRCAYGSASLFSGINGTQQMLIIWLNLISKFNIPEEETGDERIYS